MVVDRASQLFRTRYLGSLVSNQEESEREVQKRTQLAKITMSKLKRSWQSRKISITPVENDPDISLLDFSIWIKVEDNSNSRPKKDRCIRNVVLEMNTLYTMDIQTHQHIIEQLQIKCRLSTICYQMIFGSFGHIARRSPDNIDTLLGKGKVFYFPKKAAKYLVIGVTKLIHILVSQ